MMLTHCRPPVPGKTVGGAADSATAAVGSASRDITRA
jgi:hypothetical protein